MRRFRLPRYMAIVMVALAAALVLPLASHGASIHGAHTSRPASASAPISAATVADVTSTQVTAASGGLCSVPGIGDIGGLLGFCALGSSGLTGALNTVCEPSLPTPEPASAGIDAMVAPPSAGKQPSTLYDRYGVAGDYWAATNLKCSDMTSLIGNDVAGMVFDAAKSIDRVTITVYQSAAGPGIVSWLQRVTDKLITSLGDAIYFPYLAVVVILAAIWLAWQGLIRKRGTRTIEGTIWMIVACAAALFLIGKPAEVTGVGAGVSNGISQALNVAFAKLPSPGPSSCVPVQKGDPQVQPSSYSYTSGSTVVDQNADELWTVLVCKPWLVGEFGTSAYATAGGKPTPVNTYGRSLLWAQAIAVNEKPTNALIQAKQSAYAGIASSLQANDPSVYPLFQGNEWTTRLEVGFAALFAAVVAGVLVLLISVTLILLKLSFLLLLIVGPFFLLIGTHPGFGRIVALRWVEMLIGVLLKQAAVALVLSLLLYCYALIMGTSDAVLPWALKILMIALVTVAAFIYRKPFQHLFSAVGYGVIGSQQRAEADLARAGATARASTGALAAAAVPGFAAYRAGRWARRNPGQAASLAMAAASGGVGAAVAAGVQAGETGQGADADGNPTADGTAAAAGAGAGEGPGLDVTEAGWHWRPEVAPRSEGTELRPGWPAARPSRPRSTCRPATARPHLARPQLARSQLARSQPPRAVRLRQARLVFRAPAPGAWPLGRRSGAPVARPAQTMPGPARPQPQPGSPPQRQPSPQGQRSQGPAPQRQPSQRQPPQRAPSQRQPAQRQPAQRQLRSVSHHRASHRKARRRNASGRSASHPQDRHHSAAACGPAGQTAPLRRVSRGGRLPGGRQSERPAQSGRLPAGRISPRASNPRVPVRSRRAGRPPDRDGPAPFWLRPVRRK